MLSCRPNKFFFSLCAALACAQAAAAPGDSLQAFASLGVGHDDNLLRVPDGAPAFDQQLGDSWRQADAGIGFDHTYSRQRLRAQLKASQVQFDHFRQLDYNGEDAQASWDWQLGNHLQGALGATYNQALAPYTDLRSDRRNLRRQRRGFADGAWRFHPSWRLRAAASSDKSRYELAGQGVNDRIEDAAEAGAEYLPASGSEVGLVLRHLKGRYPNLVGADFSQDEVKAKVLWIATATTTVQALAGWAKRRQPALGADTSGFNGRVNAGWKPNGKLSVNGALWRDFAPIESTLLNYTLNKGVSIGAAWTASAKVRIDASASVERRAYNPRLLALAQAARGDLNDVLRSASLRAAWAPRQSLQLGAALAHQSRSGSVFLGTGRFRSNSVVLDATLQF